MIYFLSAERTPPIFQTFASNLGPFFAASLMKLPLLKKYSNSNYNVQLSSRRYHFSSSRRSCANYNNFSSHNEKIHIKWLIFNCSMFILGALFGTLYNLLQHPYLIQRQKLYINELKKSNNNNRNYNNTLYNTENQYNQPLLPPGQINNNDIELYKPPLYWTLRESFMMLASLRLSSLLH